MWCSPEGVACVSCTIQNTIRNTQGARCPDLKIKSGVLGVDWPAALPTSNFDLPIGLGPRQVFSKSSTQRTKQPISKKDRRGSLRRRACPRCSMLPAIRPCPSSSSPANATAVSSINITPSRLQSVQFMRGSAQDLEKAANPLRGLDDDSVSWWHLGSVYEATASPATGV